MPNNVFEGLDEIIERQKQAEEKAKQDHEEILDAINKANAGKQKHSETIGQSATLDGVRETIDQRNQAFSIKNFIAHSVHEYMWVGDGDEFTKGKKLSLLLIFSSVLAIVICSIVSTALGHIYSTYTFFEDIWAAFMLFALKYTVVAKKHHLAVDLAFNSFYNYEQDADGVFRQGKLKKRYSIFFVICCLCFVFQAIVIWSSSIFAAILELLSAGLIGFTAYKVKDFFEGYGPIKFTGLNESGVKTVIIFDLITNKLLIEDDYYKKYPFMK